MSEHIRISESCVDPNPLMVERQDPDYLTRFQTRERCALEIAAYVFKGLLRKCKYDAFTALSPRLQCKHCAFMAFSLRLWRVEESVKSQRTPYNRPANAMDDHGACTRTLGASIV